MNFLRGLAFLLLVGVVWSTSSSLMTKRLDQLVAIGKIPYGPVPNIAENFYSYNGLPSTFNSTIALKRSNELTKAEFEKIILDSLDSASRQNFKKYLTQTLNLSVDYQIDPYWVISVMMVESSFDLHAKSQRNAHGLMQIKPETAGHLYQLMGKKVSVKEIQNNLHHPSENIEVGIFYLKKLLQNFRMNYSLATIAYNIGPNKLKALLEKRKIDVPNFSYLLKVQTCYKNLTKNFSRELSKRPYPFERTFVIQGQAHLSDELLLRLYSTEFHPIESDILLGSENLSHLFSHSLPF